MHRQLTFLLTPVFLLGTVSVHNEQQAALSAAYARLFDAGCARPGHSRTERFALELNRHDLTVRGNEVTVACSEWRPGITATVSWVAPTRREDGTPLRLREIDYYELADARGVITFAERHESELTIPLPVDGYVKIRAVDVYGLKSDYAIAKVSLP